MKSVPVKPAQLKLILCILIGACLLISLIPLFCIARYDLPNGDDALAFSSGTAQVWADTHSFGAVLKTAFEKTMDYYNTWQGTYFSSMVMYTLTGILPVSLYGLTPVVALLVLIFSTFYLSRVLIVRCLKLDHLDWLLIALTALLFQIQLLPNVTEAVFWLNAVSLYTLPYCLLLLLFGFLLTANSSKSVFTRIALTVLAGLCATAVAGGAFSQMIPAILIVAWVLIRKIAGRDKYGAIQTGFVLLLLTLGTIASVGAPGNQARVTFEHGYYGSQGLSLFQATLRSVQSGVLFAAQYTGMAMLLFCGICGTVFFKAAKRTPIRLFHPVPVLILTFGLFCMQFMPTFYTLASSGPDRLKNLIYFSMYWLIAFNIFNLEGWMIQKHKADLFVTQFQELIKSRVVGFRHARATVVLVVALFMFLAFAQREDGFYANPSVQAAVELHTGTAAKYTEQTKNNAQEGATQTFEYDSAILP